VRLPQRVLNPVYDLARDILHPVYAGCCNVHLPARRDLMGHGWRLVRRPLFLCWSQDALKLLDRAAPQLAYPFH